MKRKATAKMLPSGNWRIQVYKNGQIKSFTAPTARQAEKMAEIWKQEQSDKYKSGMTVGDALDEYIETCKAQKYSPSTIREYSARRRNSFTAIESKPISKLTFLDVQRQMDARAKTHSPKTVKNDLSLLTVVCANYAPQLDLSRIRIAKVPKRKKLLLEETLPVDALNAAVQMYGKGEFYAYLLLIFFAGLRPSESYALLWSDISTEPITQIAPDRSAYQVGIISVSKATVRGIDGYSQKDTKTDAGQRTVTVAWAVIEELQAAVYRKETTEKVFTMKPNSVSWRWRQIRKGMGADALRYYDLRHYYATEVASSGASEEELASRMGHSTSAFSHAVYVELFAGKRNAVNAVLTGLQTDTITSIGKG